MSVENDYELGKRLTAALLSYMLGVGPSYYRKKYIDETEPAARPMGLICFFDKLGEEQVRKIQQRVEENLLDNSEL